MVDSGWSFMFNPPFYHFHCSILKVLWFFVERLNVARKRRLLNNILHRCATPINVFKIATFVIVWLYIMIVTAIPIRFLNDTETLALKSILHMASNFLSSADILLIMVVLAVLVVALIILFIIVIVLN